MFFFKKSRFKLPLIRVFLCIFFLYIYLRGQTFVFCESVCWLSACFQTTQSVNDKNDKLTHQIVKREFVRTKRKAKAQVSVKCHSMFCSETDFSFSPPPTPSTSAKMPVAPHHTVDVAHREKDLVDKEILR